MNNKALEIRTLIISEITGSITPEEKVYLAQLLEQSAEIRALSEHIHKKIASDKAGIYKSEPPSIERIVELGNNLRQRSKVRRMKIAGVTIAVAAAAAAACLGIYVTFHYYPFNKAVRSDIAQLDSNDVRLTVGLQTIKLDSTTCMISNGSLLFNNNQHLSFSDIEERTNGTLEVPSGKVSKLILSDGTIIWMNSDSKIVFPVNGLISKRNISIVGEAYVEVVKMADNPFTVHLPNREVQVLGTAFNVNTYKPGESRISLVSGSVNISNKYKRVELRPGLSGTLYGNNIHVEPFDSTSVLSWKKAGKIIISNSSIVEVIKAIERCYGVKIEVDESAKGKHSMVTLDRSIPFETFFKAYTINNELEYDLKDSVYYVRTLSDLRK